MLAMDIGNTNVKIGIFKGDELAYTWRVSTVASHTADEYGMVIYDLLRQGGHTFEDVDGAVMWGFCVLAGSIAAFVLKLPPLIVFVIVNLDELIKTPIVMIRYFQYKLLKNITK